ncbi:MAG: hypothetical protein RJAPGHWK_001163 [Candidatus Fervidibacter sp.]
MGRKRAVVTIREVAKAVGVSVATVSSVLNGRAHTRVAAETRQRVLEAARRLGYCPKRSAQALRTGLTYTLGLSVPLCPDSLLSPFFYEAVKGALKTAKQRGWLVTILGFQDRQEELALLQAAAEQRSVDGVLLFDPQDDDPRLPLLKGRLPFVVVGRCFDPEVVTVDNDNVQAAKLATQHLLRLGHRRIAFVHVPLRFVTAQDRLTGYRMAIKEAGLPFDANLLAGTEGYYGVEAGYRAFLGLLKRLRKPPTAVLAMDDTLALGVLQAAQQHGLRVPDDLAVVGFNDSPFAAHCEPPLTTVRIFAETLVEYATDALLRLIRGEPVAPKRMLVPTQLIVRASCGAMSRKNK